MGHGHRLNAHRRIARPSSARSRLASFAGGTCLAVVVAGVPACKDKPRPAPVSNEDAPALPIDRLAPSELPEGTQEVFDLKLPRDLKVERSFPGLVHATSATLDPKRVVDYFHSRVTEGSESTLTFETRFERVHPKTNPKRELTIQIREGEPGVTTCDVLLSDTTPPPVAPGLNEDERRAKAGMLPDGKLKDPLHLE